MNHKKKRLPSGNQTKSIQVNPVIPLLFWQPFKNVKIQMSYGKKSRSNGTLQKEDKGAKVGWKTDTKFQILNAVPTCLLKGHYIK